MEDMLRAYVNDFQNSWEMHLLLIEFACNNSYHTNMGWHHLKLCTKDLVIRCYVGAEIAEKQLRGPEMVRNTNEKIKVVRKKMQMAQTRHKSYADKHRKGLEFEVGNNVFLKVSPVQGVNRFGQKRPKLSPRFIGPFEILEHIGNVAY